MTLKIDPLAITDFNRDTRQKEAFLIFAITVAGKDAMWASRTVGKLLSRCPDSQRPLEFLASSNDLHNTLVANRVGQYSRITKAIQDAAKLDVETCTVEDLEACHGIGPKTARFFLLHSRPDCDCAAVDTHILKYIKDSGMDLDVPETTPQSPKKYKEMERAFLTLISLDFPGLSVAAADLLVWTFYSGRLEKDHEHFAMAAKVFPGISETS